MQTKYTKYKIYTRFLNMYASTVFNNYANSYSLSKV